MLQLCCHLLAAGGTAQSLNEGNMYGAGEKYQSICIRYSRTAGEEDTCDSSDFNIINCSHTHIRRTWRAGEGAVTTTSV